MSAKPAVTADGKTDPIYEATVSCGTLLSQISHESTIELLLEFAKVVASKLTTPTLSQHTRVLYRVDSASILTVQMFRIPSNEAREICNANKIKEAGNILYISEFNWKAGNKARLLIGAIPKS